MDRFDLSRQGISSLAQVSDDIVRQVEHDGNDGGDVSNGDQYEYALSFAQNRIIEVHAIGRFQRVSQLDLSSNKIVSLEGIQVLLKLESVNLARNNLTSVDVLAELPNLRVLSVSENSIVQLDGLRDCRELMVLDASYNNVTKWPHLGDMVTLESLDLSSNLLEAFAPSAVPLLFPDSLRRLSIAKNQIHELCGIAALGSHLTKLQSLSVEGNGVVSQVTKSEGKLGYLLANLFQSLSLDSAEGSGGFLVPRSTIAAVQHAIQTRNEDALLGFLKTGSAAAMQSESAIPLTRKAVVASTIQSSRFKVEELVLPQPPVAVAMASVTVLNATLNREPVNQRPLPPTSSLTPSLAVVVSNTVSSTELPTALSKESKMEMWKRITEERKAAQEKEKDRLQRELSRKYEEDEPASETRPTTAVAEPPQVLPVSTRTHTAADEHMMPPTPQNHLPPPPPPSSPPAPAQIQPGYPQKQQDRPRASMPAHKPQGAGHDLHGNGGGGGASITPAVIDAPNLSGQVKVLNEHVSTMRKYMKVWIKREQMARKAAARHIQRWFRQQRFRQAIATKSRARQQKWREQYSLHHCSSSSVLAATRIQRAWKSVLEHRSAILGFSRALRVKRDSRRLAGSHHQSQFINAKLIRVVARFGADVKQIQQVCVVQERAMIELWDNIARFRRYQDHRIAKAVVCFQSLWRGWKARRTHVIAARNPKSRAIINSKAPDDMEIMKRTMALQAQEIARLSQQVETLQSAVERLLAEKQTE